MSTLNRNDIRDLFLATLREFLVDKAPGDITETMDPGKDLGLDSVDGVEFACVLSEVFHCKIPDDVNPLVDDVRHCVRSVGEAIDLMYELVNKDHA